MNLTGLKPRAIKLSGGERYQRLLKEGSDTENIKSGFVVLKPQESVGEHVTEKREEVIIILDGQAQISCQGAEPITANKETVIYIPAEKKHDIKNIGDELLRYVYVVSLKD